MCENREAIISEVSLLRERHPLAASLSRRHFLKALGLLGLEGTSVFSSGLPLLAGPFALQKSAPPQAKPCFTQVPASTSGINWKHSNGRSPDYYLPETTGAGCAFIDYDNDGWMDIYLVNSGHCDFYDPNPPLRNALYHNNRDGTFTDVTEKAGVPGGGYGMGVAVGDYDGDGLPDLYVTQYGSSILYHNNGNGTFTDVTQKGWRCRSRMGFQRRLVRLRQRWTARSVRLPLCGFQQREK